MQFLDKLVTKRLVPGRDSVDNCGGSAVASPAEIPQVQFLDKFDTPVTHARCRVFFDKVVDVPVVLCNGFCRCSSSTVMTSPCSCAPSAQLLTWRIDSALGSEFKSCPPVAAHPS